MCDRWKPFHAYSSSRVLLLFVDSTTRAYRLRGATPTSDLQQPPGRSPVVS